MIMYVCVCERERECVCVCVCVCDRERERPPRAKACGARAHPISIQEQLLSRNVKRFRGGLVFKAHIRLHHSTLGLRVIKKKKKSARPPRTKACGGALHQLSMCGNFQRRLGACTFSTQKLRRLRSTLWCGGSRPWREECRGVVFVYWFTW